MSLIRNIGLAAALSTCDSPSPPVVDQLPTAIQQESQPRSHTPACERLRAHFAVSLILAQIPPQEARRRFGPRAEEIIGWERRQLSYAIDEVPWSGESLHGCLNQ